MWGRGQPEGFSTFGVRGHGLPPVEAAVGLCHGRIPSGMNQRLSSNQIPLTGYVKVKGSSPKRRFESGI
jgi:hypothetical protein